MEKSNGRARTSWPVIEGISVVSAQIGVPESLVKQVKRNGSKAFLTHNRIDTGILLPELFAALSKTNELPEGIASPQDWLATEKAKREAIKRQQDERSVMPTADAVAQASAAGSHFMSELERFCRELPPALAGLSAVEIAKRMTSVAESVRKTLKQKLADIGK